MLRVIHNQTVLGAILIDDIDDGLPNKNVHRLGSNGNPKAFELDGYANKPKQPCYVPRSQASIGLPLVAGFIDLNETHRVTMSAGKGKIAGLVAAGLVTVVHFTADQILAPVVTSAVLSGGILTITGTALDSIAPTATSVVLTGAGAVTLTEAQITGASGGSASATSIVIPASLIPSVALSTSSAKVVANGRTSNTVVLT